MRVNLVQPITLLRNNEGDGTKRRTIDGIAVPYGVPANASTGPVMFEAGSLPTDGPAPKLLRNHDPADPVGIVVERVSTDTEMLFSARISETAAGNEALVLAADGVYDGVSVGVDIIRHRFEDGVMVVEAGEWRELSLVTFPAFSEARILDVAATEPILEETVPVELEEDPEPSTNPETEEVSAMADIEAATMPTAPLHIGGAITRPRVTAGEYISAMLTGRPVPQIQAADNLLVDIPGLLPEPLLGDVWNTQYSQRPLIDAVGTRALPGGGDVFNRRYISQHTDVAQQVNELDTLASNQLIVNKQLFTKKTFGGYVNVSAQSGDWSEPALVQALVNDMVRQYARATETYVVGQMTTVASTATTTIADYTDAALVVAGLYDGAAEMFANTGAMPTHLIVHSDVWAKLGQCQDPTSGQYIFPYLNPSNAQGQMNGAAVMSGNPLGLSLVVSNDAGSGNAYLLYGPALEVYEDRSRTGGIRVENPATASATIGLWGYIAADIIGYAAPALSDYALILN